MGYHAVMINATIALLRWYKNVGKGVGRMIAINSPDNINHIIENIKEVTFVFKKFGAVIHRVYSQYFNRYMWTVKFWPPKIHKNFSHQTQRNLVLQQYRSGTHSQNHGRHFNRRVHWRRK